MILNISDRGYYDLILAILLNCNQFVYKGVLINCMNLQNDIVIEEKEFFLAATLNQLENASIDLPLVVAKISH
jgi:hypothetical protein